MIQTIYSSVMITIYIMLFLWFFKGAISSKSMWLFRQVVVIILIVGADLLLRNSLKVFYIGIVTIVVTCAFRLILQTSLMQALFAGGLFSLSLYSGRGIFIAIYAFALQQSIQQVVQNTAYYYPIMAMTVFSSGLLWFVLRSTFASDKDMKQLLNNRGQLRFVFIFLLILIVFLILVDDGRNWEQRRAWYITLYLFANLICKSISVFIFHHSLRVSVLLEYELHTRNIQEQLSRQINHYQSYQKFTESFRKFKHDYNNLMAFVKTLIRNNENTKALSLIDDIHDAMQKEVVIHKAYSNNYMLDAILQDAANACEEKDICFSAQLHIPQNVDLDDLNTVRVATNIINNAIEACLKVPASKRFIDIVGSYTDEWIYVQSVNSFNGQLLVRGGELVSTKKDKDIHGLGLGIVKEIVESIGGLVLIEPDRNENLFRIKLHIPRISL